MEQAYPPGGENPSWGEVPEKNQQQQQQQQKPPAMSQPTDQYRQKLRLKYGLPEQPCGDYCTGCCCLPCSRAQQTGEIKSLKNGLPEQSCGDCCTDCCCTDCYCTDCCCLPCSLAQQTSELKSRGVDPNLGWKWEPNREAHLNSVPQVPKMEKYQVPHCDAISC
ncbi:hypothetical protein BDL97_16G046500 [Sphagnum fallax]|nr:hypothetical protein BDL97_16G046500 [Sphagnum fallax]